MLKIYRQRIAEVYGLTLANVSPAPRGFVAETHVLEDTRGKRYFCKLVRKPSFIQEIVASLPALAALHRAGMRQVNYPIATLDGPYHLMFNGTLIVLYNHIEAQQSYDYDLFTFGRLTAEIHKLTPQIATTPPEQTIAYRFQRVFEQALSERHAPTDDPIVQDLRAILRQHSAQLAADYELYQRTLTECTNKTFPLVITHGDAPGNVLVQAPTAITIVDWDGMLLASPERDLWFLADRAQFMAGYRNQFPAYVPDPLAQQLQALTYYFESLAHYLNEILPYGPLSYRQGHLRMLAEYLNPQTSWITPYLVALRKRRGASR